MNLHDILSQKGSALFTVAPRAKLAEALQVMVQHNCGSLVVCENESMVGIISERDLLRALADSPQALNDMQVADRMTRDVITGCPSDDLNKVMGIMTQHRIRHLPVLENGRTCGLISIGDIVKAQHEQLARENHFLMSYIQS